MGMHCLIPWDERYYLEIYFKGNIPILSHSFIYSIIDISMDPWIHIHFKLWVKCYNTTLFCSLVFQFYHWEFFQLTPVCLCQWRFLKLWALSYILAAQNAPGLPCVFPFLVLELAISPRTLGFLSEDGIRNQDLGAKMLIVIGVSLLLGPLSL